MLPVHTEQSLWLKYLLAIVRLEGAFTAFSAVLNLAQLLTVSHRLSRDGFLLHLVVVELRRPMIMHPIELTVAACFTLRTAGTSLRLHDLLVLNRLDVHRLLALENSSCWPRKVQTEAFGLLDAVERARKVGACQVLRYVVVVVVLVQIAIVFFFFQHLHFLLFLVLEP